VADNGPELKYEVGVSAQGGGTVVALHFEIPGAAFALGFPYEYAEELETELPKLISAGLTEAKRMRSGLITPPSNNGGSLITPKGN